MKPTKTILIAGNLVGGQYKSTTIGTLVDCLQHLRYSAKTIAIDMAGFPMLQILQPATSCYKLNSPIADIIRNAVTAPEEITIIDCPGANPEILTILAEAARESGARIVVGIIVNAQSDYSIECGIEFSQAFSAFAPEYLVFAVCAENSPNFLESPDGENLVKLAQGRVIEFPAYSPLMRRDNNALPAVPSVHIAQAKNVFEAQPWKRYQTEALKSVAKHAEWLVGNPA